MTRPSFRMDNTEGYSQDELDEMNAIYNERVADLDPEAPTYKTECDHISEQIEREIYSGDDE